MKLYYISTTRAVRPRWLLEEMGIPYELISVTMSMTQQPEYRQLHPHGKVPVLVDDEITIFESAAICAYLADKYPEKAMAPSPGTPARGYYYQWLFYASLTLEPPVEKFLFHALPHLPEKLLPHKQYTQVSLPEIKQWFTKVCEPLNEVLRDNNYLVDNRFSAADVVTGGVLLWALKLGMLKEDNPVKAYITHLMERPAFLAADEGVYAKVDFP
ncbi:MAG: glutathione S-transferase family protein [Symploca sp. SIO1B1]|nr:glutathione S-transferase family protein [Symploca sp. SIO1A3]NER96958.1 glutathione S-transferase family protein [Symploca sp. SIO1B1]